MYQYRQGIFKIWNEKQPMKNEKDFAAYFFVPVKYFHKLVLKKLASCMCELLYHLGDEKV